MRYLVLISSLFSIFHLLLAGEKEIVKPTLTEVTVYPQGAQLFQKATYNVKPGITEVVIEGVSPFIDVNSLQVKATGSVVMLDASYSKYFPEPVSSASDGIPLKIKKEIKLLQDSVKLMTYSIQELKDEVDVLLATKNIIASNGAVRGVGKVNDSINLLKQTIDYYSVKMNEINKKMLSLNRKKNNGEELLRDLNDRLSQLYQYAGNNGSPLADKGPVHRIVVTLSAKEIASGKITVSYVVSQAGWIPKYDLRSDGVSSKINLTYKAQVYQNSGLKWENVKLNISTNNPYQNKTKPELNPWYIDYYNYYNSQKEERRAQPAAERADETSFAYTNSISNMKALGADAFVSSVRQLTSMEFKIDLPYTIESDNLQHMVLVKVMDLDADYKYYTVPKLDNSVYLVAELSKMDELGLVPAQANIFFDGTYIGETYIDPSSMEDTLHLSMGRDPNIVVKRTLVKKETKEKIINDKKEKTMVYSFEVKNLKATPAELVVQDQLPITTNPEIVIEALDTGKGKVNSATGLVEWTFTLKPKESKSFHFSYKVKHNKDITLPVY